MNAAFSVCTPAAFGFRTSIGEPAIATNATCRSPTKQELFSHLTQCWRDLFNASFDVLLCDLTSAYFEVIAADLSEYSKRRHGYSRDKRIVHKSSSRSSSHPKDCRRPTTTREEVEQWLTAPPNDALALQRLLPDQALQIAARGKEDGPDRD